MNLSISHDNNIQRGNEKGGFDYAERRGALDTKDLIGTIELYGRCIYSFCCMLTKNEHDADDLYQETFLKAMEMRCKIDMDNNPKGFLISIAAGIWKNRRRKIAWRQRIAPTRELDESLTDDYAFVNESNPEDIAISNELKHKIWEAADSLNNKLKIPLYMYYTAKMSVKEISRALNIPQGTVKSRLYKARKNLGKILEVGEYEKFGKVGKSSKTSPFTHMGTKGRIK